MDALYSLDRADMDQTPTSEHHKVLDAALMERLSRRLRYVRQIRGVTLKALADAASCSEGLLSKFENGKNYPSLPMLGRIAQALDVPIATLLVGGRDWEPIIHRYRPPSDGSAMDASVDIERLAIDVEHVTPRCSILNIAPGKASPIQIQEVGEEIGVVLEGHPSLVVEGCSHRLDAGDAFAFRAEQLHNYQNTSLMRARIFRIYTPSTLTL